ncbi:type VII secretion-associated serine protease mycosin [Micromonospora craniellae]|uniref:Type VII secretion-associated serine protease mycosin n=1 Tax=Micromonospora craniellae TaxID=2294034 RepID=A0A372FUT6_9ACTN|nr:type VII secretion-associated serine protease mycosin [Micromonospora craniellae]QOC89814.1 type VII secretion-associated serine protease mycosin [Micromonospora craniellae]RFS44468.1 type VII secretion-associated serine protease mycosin [Micromonospora craniellae]
MRLLTRPMTTVALTAASVLAALVVSAAPALADSTRDDSWHVKTLELAEMHRISRGEGVTVAVIDTGVDATHPDLRDNVVPGVDLYDDKAKGRVDREGHGTGMASLIAGHGHGPGDGDGVLGVAPKAKILPVTIKSERSAVIAPTAIAAGINWAVDNGADIVNVSLGASHNEELNRAVDRAYQRNVVVVAAVGNRKDAIIGNPARHPGAIAVNGTDRAGVISKEAALPAEEVNIAAPGEDIVQAAPGGRYVTAIGNSGSAAIVSGAMALVKAKYPDLNAYQLFERLLETTRDAGDPGRDLYYGWGVLDLRAALTGEPDGRARSAATPDEPELDAGLEAARAVEGPGPAETVIVVLIWVGILVLLVGAVTAVILLRRARRARAVAVDGDGPVGPTPGTHVPPAGPDDPADESVWRRPPG